jgi:EAL domain-containing protein (putative c-di-GMP-specific phosphodiesterase class I)
MSTVNLAAGDLLFREGDPPDGAYVIESGRIEVSTVKDGHRVVLSELGAGDLLGEMAVLDESPRTATALALEPSTLTRVDRSQLLERLEQSDPIIRTLMQGLLARYRSSIATLKGQAAVQTAPVVDAPGLEEALGAVGKIRLDSQLRAALSDGQLELRLQPILDVPADRVTGYEALIRWLHPQRGYVSPGEFIALAEETSLIVPVGEFALREACAAWRALDAAGRCPEFIAVNVSARQLAAPGFVERVAQVLAECGVPARHIKIEITESQRLDYMAVNERMAELRGLGIKVALDDFGTGFSNLGHLHHLNFDAIKLDQIFVREMLELPRAMAIVESIVRLSASLGSEMVVEGIETAEHLARIGELGVRYAQGFHIGKPQPLNHFL